MTTSEPDWVTHVMWWAVYPLGFVGAPIRPADGEQSLPNAPLAHRLERIEHWLDHLVGLGLNGLQLGPIFAATTHGYDTEDYFRIDPRLGDDADFDRLVEAAHARGVRVILDGVFNHVSRRYPAFANLQQAGPDSPDARLFRVRWEGWAPEAELDADVFEGHHELVALDHGSPAVEDLVVDVMNHWLARGIDGWRLDAAYAVPPAFWSRVLPRVRAEHPAAWFTGEVIHGDQAAIVRESTIDSLTQYELWQGVWHGIADRNLFELAHALTRHDELLQTFVPSTFVGNHDVTRIATAVGDIRHLPHALAVLFTVAGTPSLYAGDELAYRGTKTERLGGDDDIRPEFADTAPAHHDLDEQASVTRDLVEGLVALRRQRPWLHAASTDIVHTANESLVFRTATAEGAVVTALHLGEAPVTVPAGGATRVEAGSGSVSDGRVRLEPHGWAVLS